jgi:hypothetical protein
LAIEGSISENFKNFEVRFNDFCIQTDYRDLTKHPEVEAHYKKPVLELAVLRSAVGTNKLIEEIATKTDEQVNWTKQRYQTERQPQRYQQPPTSTANTATPTESTTKTPSQTYDEAEKRIRYLSLVW